MSPKNSNPKRNWFRKLLLGGATRTIGLAPTLLCPLALTGAMFETASGQTVPATRGISDAAPAMPVGVPSNAVVIPGAVQVDTAYVSAWLTHSQTMLRSGNVEQATIAFAEALRGRNMLIASDQAAVEGRVRDVASTLAEQKVTPAQVKSAASLLGNPRFAPVQTENVATTSSSPFSAPIYPPSIAPNAIGVMPAGATNGGGQVAQGVFDPQADSTQLRPASSTRAVAYQEEPSFANLSGDELYQKGIELLGRGDRQGALDVFRQAWQHQGELDPAIRNSLRDKLASLHAANAGAEPISAQPASPQDQALAQEYQRWISEVTGEISDARTFRESEPHIVSERLQVLRTRVSQANLNGDARQRLLTLVDRAIAEHQIYVNQNLAAIDQNTKNRQIKEEIALEQEKRYKIDRQIASLVEAYNDLMDKGEFMQAEVTAKNVGALDPNSTIASLLIARARNARRIGEYEEIRTLKEDGLVDVLLDVDRSSQPVSDANSFQFPEGWQDISRRRLAENRRESDQGLSPIEAEIWQRLKQPVQVNFNQRPLRDVAKTLSEISGIPINIDERSLQQEGISADELVTLDLPSQIQMRSALALMLNTRNLDFQVANEVLTITSIKRTAQANRVVTYNVKDLVIPIPNFITDYNSGMAGALRNAYETVNSGLVARAQQRFSGNGFDNLQFAGGSANPASGALGQLAGGNLPGGGLGGGFGLGGGMMPGTGLGGFNNGPAYGNPPAMNMGSPTAIGGGAAMADFQTLINLIQQTIEPDSWLDQGGTSTIQEYRQSLSLVVSAPQTTHEKIADLLETLRRLGDVQVTIEVKFITLTDNFFERMGIDFDVRVEDGYSNVPISERHKNRTVIGISSGSTATNPFPFTADLDVAFDQNNFAAAVPQFGGFQDGLGGSIGFAILSQLEMFFFMNAAQGDSRSNVLQAPRVTMFDGQFASITDTVSRPFVTSLIPVVGDFAVAQQPVIVVLNEGTILNVQSTISPDKRFVRLTLNPSFSQIDRVDTFTFEGSRTTRSSSIQRGDNLLNPDQADVNENEEEEDTVIAGTTVQQPSFAQTSVSTTVSVPDGGTILLGGIKRMRESRIERGVPILSKIPYLNRLFKNTAIGRETSTLMMTVTPRIIIQEEEEEKIGGTP